MTIASQTSRISYTGNSSITEFAIPFFFGANADIVVYVTDTAGTQTLQVLGTDYTLTGETLSAGGACTFTIAPTTGYTVVIYRDPALTQTTSYNDNDPFPASSHERALDKALTIDQRTRDLVTRAIHLPDGETTLSTVLGSVATRKNKLLSFDTNGALSYSLGPTFVGSTYTGVAEFDTLASAQIATLASSVNLVRTGGYATTGDGGGAVYKRVGSQPSHALKFQSADGAWFEYAERNVYLKACGAKCDGATDDRSAWSNAIGYANVSGNTSIVVPPGLSLINTALPAITADNIVITDDGCGPAARVRPASGFAVFTVGNTASTITTGFRVRGIRFTYASAPSTASTLFDLRNVVNVVFDAVVLDLVGVFISGGVSGTAGVAQNIFVVELTGNCANIAIPFIDLRNGSGIYGFGGQIFVSGVSVPVHPAAMTVASGRQFINANSGTWDTIKWFGGLIERFDYGVNIVATALTINNGWFIGTVFDYCNNGIRLYADTGGTIVSFKFIGCWITAWGGAGVTVDGPGIHDFHRFDNCEIFLTGTHGVNLTADASRTRVSECNIYANNRLAGGSSGITITGGSTGAKITGNKIGTDTTALGLPYRCAHGVAVGADCADLLIQGNSAGGSTDDYNLAANTAGSTTRLIRNNPGASYAGIKSGGVWAIAASASAFTNKTSHFAYVMIAGGTVTVIALDGTTITSATSGTFPLPPGGTITVTYSVTPTFIVRVEQ